jgi:hypothetical protein
MRTFIHLKSTQSHSHASTQYSPRETPMNILPSMKDKDYIYINVGTQVTPIENQDISIQSIPEKISSKKIDDEMIHDQRNSLMNELKQVLSSSNSKTNLINEENKHLLPNHTVRSLVSIFETTKPSNLSARQKPNIELAPPKEEIQSPIIHDTIEQYANEIASNIVDNAVLTATTTTVYHNEQLHRRFSFYKNGGGYGKSLLFQSNTFVPLNDASIDRNHQGIFFSI